MEDREILELEENEILQEGTVYSETESEGWKDIGVGEIIGETIINDYATGKLSNEFKGGLHKCVDVSGKLVGNWEAGRLMPLGQIFRDSNGVYWRATGRNFEREAFPYATYELIGID